MTLESLERLQSHTNELTELKRRHYLPETDVHEDDTSHSYSVALLGWRLNEMLELGLDTEKILKYAMVHDFVEVYAGDVNTFASPEAKHQKKQDEAAALSILVREYADSPDFIATIQAYESKSDDEARFVWACDKIQALLQGQLDSWRCYYELKITDAQFLAKLHELRPDVLPALLEFYDDFCIDCLSTYHFVEPQDMFF